MKRYRIVLTTSGIEGPDIIAEAQAFSLVDAFIISEALQAHYNRIHYPSLVSARIDDVK
ncbi:MAG TPA: hypothetical protein PKB02_02550 [Anaerohalosphaeraceae bacterium]|nr:hypothetical protein [Anaerohalosphaeraceae bacterium]